MKIVKLEYLEIGMDLTTPYTIAYETIDKAVNIFLKLSTDSGVTGFGCAAPDQEVTGETPGSVKTALDRIVHEKIRGQNPLYRNQILANLVKHLADQPAALAAVDMALFDILGKSANLPLWKILGGTRDRILTSVTIGILPLSETIEMAKEFVARGFKCLKIKGGLNLNQDIERINKLRSAIGPDIGLRFDANQGFSLEESIKFAKRTYTANLELIEQPTDSKRPELLARVKEMVQVPVMADESLISLQDARQLASNKKVDMFNIKLMKAGGISEALHINSVARSADIKIMVGCMDESALAISAGMHFALTGSEVKYADLDGHLDLKNDPAAGCVSINDGYLIPADKPGLGCGIDVFT